MRLDTLRRVITTITILNMEEQVTEQQIGTIRPEGVTRPMKYTVEVNLIRLRFGAVE